LRPNKASSRRHPRWRMPHKTIQRCNCSTNHVARPALEAPLQTATVTRRKVAGMDVAF
jgi:hypothetical protein